MNRRHFMRALAGAAAGFTILPPATTYSRVWRAKREPVVASSEDLLKALEAWFPGVLTGPYRGNVDIL